MPDSSTGLIKPWALLNHGTHKRTPPEWAWPAWLITLLAGVLVLTFDIGTESVYTMRDLVAFLVVMIAVMACIPDDGTSALPSLLYLIIPSVVIKGVWEGGWSPYTIWLFTFGFFPVADIVIGDDVLNQSKEEQKALHHTRLFRLVTLLVVPVQISLLCWGAYTANNGVAGAPLTTSDLIGMGLGVGLFTGAIGITVAHELCHKGGLLEPLSGRFLMCSVCYGHFHVEHTLGHHKAIATDEDPASARYGETFYAFLPRVVLGEYLSAWHIELNRLRTKRLPAWHNEMIWYTLVSAAICATLCKAFGSAAVPFFAIQSITAILLFESVNYLEHYGLERREVEGAADAGAEKTHRPGLLQKRYEPVTAMHSWDTAARLTNTLLFKLQRHTDHHAHAGKRFQTLQLDQRSPQLPSGYATCILLAFVPPLWRAVMHPRLMAFRATQKGQVWRHGPQPHVKAA